MHVISPPLDRVQQRAILLFPPLQPMLLIVHWLLAMVLVVTLEMLVVHRVKVLDPGNFYTVRRFLGRYDTLYRHSLLSLLSFQTHLALQLQSII